MYTFPEIFPRLANYTSMPRRTRIVVPGLPHHLTQRGNGCANIFDTVADRTLFLDLLARYSRKYALTIWGCCLMSNHFHLIAVPDRDDSPAKVLGPLESDYARYLNVHRHTSGHLWQACYYSVPMDPPHCWRALAYVERNPVRAGMVDAAEQYPWSSAGARLGLRAAPAWLRLEDWREQWTAAEWRHLLRDRDTDALGAELRGATLNGFPLGQELVERLERQFGRRLHRGQSGRPPKKRQAAAGQGSLSESA